MARAGIILLAVLLATDLLARLSEPDGPLRRVSIVLAAGGVVFIAAQFGRVPGILAGALSGAYSLYYFVTFRFDEPSAHALLLGAVIGATLLGLGTLVGTLRSRADEANERAISSLQEANRDLAALNESLQSFAYVVSHDLKEPVRAMAAYLDEALAHATKPETIAAVEAARASNQRLTQLLLGVLEVARASRLDPADLRPLDPLAVLGSASCSSRYAGAMRERGATIETIAAPETPPVLATPEHLAQALGNLILNSIHHSDKAAPRIRVRVARSASAPGRVDIVVEDDGPGFPARPPELMGRVSHHGAATSRGGFGLLIVRRAVERLHGELWLERSAQLGGASARMTLPAADAD